MTDEKPKLKRPTMTDTYQKQTYRWYMAKSIALPEPDCNIYPYKIILNFIYDKKTREGIIERIGEEKFKHLWKTAKKHVKKYEELAQIRRLILECKEEKQKKEYIEQLKIESSKVDVINRAIHQLFWEVTFDKDVRNIGIPREMILHAEDNKMPAEFEKKRREEYPDEDDDEDDDKEEKDEE